MQMNLSTTHRLMNTKHGSQRLRGVRDRLGIRGREALQDSLSRGSSRPVPFRVDRTHGKEQGRRECAHNKHQRSECWPSSGPSFSKGKAKRPPCTEEEDRDMETHPGRGRRPPAGYRDTRTGRGGRAGLQAAPGSGRSPVMTRSRRPRGLHTCWGA